MSASYAGNRHDPSYYRLNNIQTPSKEYSESIGSYANGCLRGGIELPKFTPYYQLMRLSRKRYFVHQDLYEFIDHFSKDITKNHPFGGIVVGDTGRAIGGPMPSGHASHQIGLDVDIWLRPRFDRILSDGDREKISATSHVRPNQTLRKTWHKNYTNFILKAASYPSVARIFVNPAIKKQICNDIGQKKWSQNINQLAKIRPWYGHDAHMHVRLKCPTQDENCVNQAPPKRAHGCTGHDLTWWFSQEARHPKKKKKKPHKRSFSDLPPLCQVLYQELTQK